MAKASDNVFPYVHVAPAAAPSSPAAGSQRLYLDSADGNKLKRKDSSGTVTTIEGGGSGAAAFVGARVYNSAAQACASGVDTYLTFDSERFDTDSIHSTSSNTNRLTAPTTGYYAIAGNVMIQFNSTGARGLGIRVNGTTQIALSRIGTVTTTSEVTILNIATIYALTAGDYVELGVYQTSGTSLNTVTTGNFSPEFMLHKIG